MGNDVLNVTVLWWSPFSLFVERGICLPDTWAAGVWKTESGQSSGQCQRNGAKTPLSQSTEQNQYKTKQNKTTTRRTSLSRGALARVGQT